MYTTRLNLGTAKDANPEKIDQLLWKLRARTQDFTFVVFDLPEVLGAKATAHLAALCDGTVLVVGADRTRWQVADHARRALTDARANVLGTVLNRRHFPIPQWLYQTL